MLLFLLPLPHRPQAPASPSLLCPRLAWQTGPPPHAEEASRPGTGSNLIPGSSSSLPLPSFVPFPLPVLSGARFQWGWDA